MGGYNEVHGPLDWEIWKKAVQNLVNEADSFHIQFSEVEYQPWIEFCPPVKFEPFYQDLSQRPNPQQEALQWMVEEFKKPFSINSNKLYEFGLIKLSGEHFYAFLKVHHIISDGVSIGLLVKRIIELYNQLFTNSPIESLNFSYRNFIEEDIQYKKSKNYQLSMNYWGSTLAGSEQGLIPSNKVSLIKDGFINKRYVSHIQKSRYDIPKQINDKPITPFQFYLTLFALYLYKNYHKKDFIIGVPILNRPGKKFKDIIGMFSKFLPVRITIEDSMTFMELFNSISQSLTESYKYSKFPISAIYKLLQLRADQNLFDAVLSYDPTEFYTHYQGCTVETKALANQAEEIPLCWFIRDNVNPTHWEWFFDYRNDYLDDTFIAHSKDHILTLIEHVLSNPNVLISQLSFLTKKEEYLLLETFNNTHRAYTENESLYQLFENQAHASPDKPAITFINKTLTYKELYLSVNKLVGCLNHEGVKPGTFIGIFMKRSGVLIESMLAVLKLRGVCVYLDPELPQERLAYIIENSKLSLILSTSDTAPISTENVNRIDVDHINSNDISDSFNNPQNNFKSADPAFVIYTSGSTGQPKGVLLNHKMLVNLINSEKDLDNIVFENKRILQFSTFNFDMSYHEVFVALCCGGHLVILEDEKKVDIQAFLHTVNQHQIQLLYLPTAYFHVLMTKNYINHLPSSIEHFLPAGEELVLTEELKEYVAHNNVVIHNQYGPTETHVATTYQIHKDTIFSQPERPSIGKPIANAKILILSGEKLVPVGIEGEICIAGDCLALGYLNNPDLTRQKFVPNPFNAEHIMYRTGDTGRWMADGTIQFLGRKDLQVKIRGYRVELGEIESRIMDFEGITSCSVIADKSSTGESVLKAFYTSPEKVCPNDIKEYLAQYLPDYMIPNNILQIEKIPLTKNGKVERELLSTYRESNLAANDFVAPETEDEKKLETIWKSLLGIEKVGLYDSFYDLSGNSIKIIILSSEIDKSFNKSITIRDLLVNPTIRKIASLLYGEKSQIATIDLQKEAFLSSEFDMSIKGKLINSKKKTTLLTGATGFVGAFLLQELLINTDNTIYCLVRADDKNDAAVRIKRNLERYAINLDKVWDRIIAVPGDLSATYFGLSQSAYKDLSESVDRIIHNGAAVNHALPYGVLKNINVEGTRKIIDFAVNGTTIKPIHFISTVGVFSHRDSIRNVDETSNIDNEKHLETEGYTSTKWVAEKICVLAIEKGVPITIHRLGLITSCSTKGIMNSSDWFPSLLKTCVQSGLLFTQMEKICLNLTPVDFAAAAIRHLMTLDFNRAQFRYHIVSPQTISLRDIFKSIESHEKSFTLISGNQWLEAIKKAKDGGTEYPIYSYISKFTEKDMKEIDRVFNINNRFGSVETMNQLKQFGLVHPELDEKLLKRYLAV
jgi:amino acid adenylation domain-containing protein/thioester reductase-like protein